MFVLPATFDPYTLLFHVWESESEKIQDVVLARKYVVYLLG